MPTKRIISGGQTGVDTAALRLGLIHGIPIGGTVPKGYRREDGMIPDVYRPHLIEGDSSLPARRTAINVEDSDATLIANTGALEGGTRLTVDLCLQRAKPHLVVDLDHDRSRRTVSDWLLGFPHQIILNVAGPRESKRPGIARRAYDFLERTIIPVRDVEQAPDIDIRDRVARLLGAFFVEARRSTPVVDLCGVDSIERDVMLLLDRSEITPELRGVALLEPRGAADALKARDSRLATLLASLGTIGARGEGNFTQPRLF